MLGKKEDILISCTRQPSWKQSEGDGVLSKVAWGFGLHLIRNLRLSKVAPLSSSGEIVSDKQRLPVRVTLSAQGLSENILPKWRIYLFRGSSSAPHKSLFKGERWSNLFECSLLNIFPQKKMSLLSFFPTQPRAFSETPVKSAYSINYTEKVFIKLFHFSFPESKWREKTASLLPYKEH